jgi:hypothetical protein
VARETRRVTRRERPVHAAEHELAATV